MHATPLILIPLITVPALLAGNAIGGMTASFLPFSFAAALIILFTLSRQISHTFSPLTACRELRPVYLQAQGEAQRGKGGGCR